MPMASHCFASFKICRVVLPHGHGKLVGAIRNPARLEEPAWLYALSVLYRLFHRQLHQRSRINLCLSEFFIILSITNHPLCIAFGRLALEALTIALILSCSTLAVMLRAVVAQYPCSFARSHSRIGVLVGTTQVAVTTKACLFALPQEQEPSLPYPPHLKVGSTHG